MCRAPIRNIFAHVMLYLVECVRQGKDQVIHVDRMTRVHSHCFCVFGWKTAYIRVVHVYLTRYPDEYLPIIV